MLYSRADDVLEVEWRMKDYSIQEHELRWMCLMVEWRMKQIPLFDTRKEGGIWNEKFRYPRQNDTLRVEDNSYESPSIRGVGVGAPNVG